MRFHVSRSSSASTELSLGRSCSLVQALGILLLDVPVEPASDAVCCVPVAVAHAMQEGK